MGIEQLLEKASSYIKEQDLTRIREAYEFADQAHYGQVRKSGEPYILHPLAVAEILVNMQMDTISIIAALLHDVVEDTTVSLETVREKFGATCAMIVDGLTKLEKIKFKSKEEHQNENYRKMFVAMAQDIRVILIKLADRLHNMRTLKHQSEEAQRRIADETLEIFLPDRASSRDFCDQVGDGGYRPPLFESAAVLPDRQPDAEKNAPSASNTSMMSFRTSAKS